MCQINPHPGGGANSQGTRSLSQHSEAWLLGTIWLQNDDVTGMLGACCPPCLPLPQERLVLLQLVHTPRLWEAFPGQPHPALATTYSQLPSDLGPKFSMYSVALVYVLLCKCSHKAIYLGTSLVVQWLRIRLRMQGTQVRALVWEDPTRRRAAKPVRHNY